MSKRQGTRKRTAPQRFDFYWRMMADTDLSPTAKCVAAALLFKFHNAKSSRCNPGAASIARTAGLARRTVFYAIVELKDAGWITVESTKGGSASHTNQYGFDFKRVKSASPQTGAQDAPPTGAQDAPVHEMGGRGAQFAHEPLRTTHPFGVGGGEENSDCRAPDGAAAEFEELRQLWQRPYGMNVAKALAAFNRVVGDGEIPAVLILESARRWVAAREPAFLPALERWLDDGAWRNEPPARRSNGHHKPSAAEVAASLARGEGGRW